MGAEVGPRGTCGPSLGSVSSPVRIRWAQRVTLPWALGSSGRSSGVGQQGGVLKYFEKRDGA